MFGVMVEGKIMINYFLVGEDCLSMILCFEKMGVLIKREDEYVEVEGKGIEGLSEFVFILDVGNLGMIICLMFGIFVGVLFYMFLIGDELIVKCFMSCVMVFLCFMGVKIDGCEYG